MLKKSCLCGYIELRRVGKFFFVLNGNDVSDLLVFSPRAKIKERSSSEWYIMYNLS